MCYCSIVTCSNLFGSETGSIVKYDLYNTKTHKIDHVMQTSYTFFCMVCHSVRKFSWIQELCCIVFIVNQWKANCNQLFSLLGLLPFTSLSCWYMLLGYNDPIVFLIFLIDHLRLCWFLQLLWTMDQTQLGPGATLKSTGYSGSQLKHTTNFPIGKSMLSDRMVLMRFSTGIVGTLLTLLWK